MTAVHVIRVARFEAVRIALIAVKDNRDSTA